ncbi:hypothetical protein M0R45_020259 [Rubus argutus]|uniref:Uncharacterized protein n=1 Tax=Rubus argutus TaxID=59490 RepID=A0AAW1X7T1_RUBAR
MAVPSASSPSSLGTHGVLLATTRSCCRPPTTPSLNPAPYFASAGGVISSPRPQACAQSISATKSISSANHPSLLFLPQSQAAFLAAVHRADCPRRTSSPTRCPHRRR